MSSKIKRQPFDEDIFKKKFSQIAKKEDEEFLDTMGKIKTKESTLEQYCRAQQFGFKDKFEEIYNLFFEEMDLAESVYEEFDEIAHNVMQYNFQKFFTKKKISIIKEFNYSCFDNGSCTVNPIKYASLKYQPNKTMKIYSEDSNILGVDDKGYKFFITITKNNFTNTFFYAVSTTSDALSFFQDFKNYCEKHNFYRNQKIDAQGRFLSLEDASWDDVVMPDDIKETIYNNTFRMFEISDLLKKNKLDIRRGIILNGPPGTGKTQICKALARQCQFTVIYVLPSHIGSIASITNIIKIAKSLSPTLLILEDIDYLAMDRDHAAGGLVVELMNRLDGIESTGDIITVATTNHIGIVEDAVKNRPGRFDRVIKVDEPKKKQKIEMFIKFTKEWHLDEDVDFEQIVKKTEKMTGAYIKDICKTAVLFALMEKSHDPNGVAVLKKEHFEKSLKEIKDKKYTNNEAVMDNVSGMGFAHMMDQDQEDN